MPFSPYTVRRNHAVIPSWKTEKETIPAENSDMLKSVISLKVGTRQDDEKVEN